MAILERKDVPLEQTWNKETVYPSWQAWQADYHQAEADLARLANFAGTFSQGPEQLAAWFDAYDVQLQRVVRLFDYARMHVTVDSGDTEAKGYWGQAYNLIGQFQAKTAFVAPEILALGDVVLAWSDSDPALAPFKPYFDHMMRLKAHKRSREVEELLGMLVGPFSGIGDTIGELTNNDLKFADAEDSQGAGHTVHQATLYINLQSPDTSRRKSAWENYADAYLAVENTFAAGYLANVKRWLFEAQARKYDTVLEYRLAASNTPPAIFYTLIDTFKENLPVWHRYWDVKRRILGQEQIHPYDVWAPIVRKPPLIPYKQAVDWICAAMEPAGDEYVTVMRRGCLDGRWVDWAPNAGKRAGAAASRMFKDKPPFIYMAYDDSINAMSVLAHELGHAMHFYFSYQNAHTVYNSSDMISSTVTETASNFNQAMLRAYLKEAKKDDPEFQIALIDEAIFNFHRYFFTMPTLARLEDAVFTRAQEGSPLTIRDLKALMKQYFAEGYGETMTDDPERTAITWAQYQHLYTPFYTFQYAIGISAATALANGVLAGQNNAAANYLNFLKAGGSLYTMELFDLAGVDMDSPEPARAAFRRLAETVDQLEALAA